MSVHHLEYDGTIERNVQRIVDVGHATFANAMHDAVAAAGNVAKRSDRRIRRLCALARQHWQQLAAAKTARSGRPVPGAAIRTEHFYPPNSIRTKTYGGHGPV